MFALWLKRFFLSSGHWLKFETVMSLSGFVLGTACLTAALTMVSSYETTLTRVLISRAGHVTISSKKGFVSEKKFSQIKPDIEAAGGSAFPYMSMQALAVNHGVLKGIVLEGLPPSQLTKQLIDGELGKKTNQAVLARQLLKDLDVPQGGLLKIAYDRNTSENWDEKALNIQEVEVSGLIDLGLYDLNSRYVAMSLESLREMMSQPHSVTGWRVFLPKKDISQEFLNKLKKKLGPGFLVQDWKSWNPLLMSAIETDKAIIFFVLLILIASAGFNVSNQMFIEVLRRFRDIGILKSMGAAPRLIVQLFLAQSVLISAAGAFMGYLLGVLVCWGLFYFYDVWGSLAPSEVYHLNEIILDFRLVDFVLITVSVGAAGVLASVLPIRKALKLTPKEGLDVS